MSKNKERVSETRKNLKMSWSFIRDKKKTIVLMIILSIILSIISVVVPILSAQLIIKLTSSLLEELLMVAIFIFIVEITRNFVRFALRKVTDIYMVETVTNIQMEMFKETLKIKASEIDKNNTGTFIDRVNDDAGGIINIFSDMITYFFDFISNVGILFACLVINPIMFIYFIISSLILSYINIKDRNAFYKRDKIRRKVREKRTSLISEVIRGIRDVKLLNAQSGILVKTREQLDEVNTERIKMDKTRRNYDLLHGSVRDLFDVVFISLSVLLISQNSLSISAALVLNTYRGRIESLLSVYDRFSNLFKQYNISATRVFEVLGNHFEKEKSGTKELKENIKSISFSNVNFSYLDTPVLKDVSFTINKGERIGFVGESGSGKSTIFSLISKLYTGENGKILINGININDINNDSLRSHISLISQSPYIFNFSVLDNLKIGNINANMDEIIEVCKKASIYDRIIELENGFNTIVGEGGVTLSGGEKQRLAIARSLLKKSDVLLFDEATSSLDNITQNEVQQSIYGLDRSKTILIIAHRLSTVVHCDRIIVMDQGKIIDIGTHKELLKICKKYQELFKYEEVENY